MPRRAIDEITREKLKLCACDVIYLEELRRAILSERICESFAAHTGIRIVARMGERSTASACAPSPLATP